MPANETDIAALLPELRGIRIALERIADHLDGGDCDDAPAANTRPVVQTPAPPAPLWLGLDWKPIDRNKGIGWSAQVDAGQIVRLVVKFRNDRKGRQFFGCCYGDGGQLTDVGWVNANTATGVANELLERIGKHIGAVDAL